MAQKAAVTSGSNDPYLASAANRVMGTLLGVASPNYQGIVPMAERNSANLLEAGNANYAAFGHAAVTDTMLNSGIDALNKQTGATLQGVQDSVANKVEATGKTAGQNINKDKEAVGRGKQTVNEQGEIYSGLVAKSPIVAFGTLALNMEAAKAEQTPRDSMIPYVYSSPFGDLGVPYRVYPQPPMGPPNPNQPRASFISTSNMYDSYNQNQGLFFSVTPFPGKEE